FPEGENALCRHGLGTGRQSGYQLGGLRHEFLQAQEPASARSQPPIKLLGMEAQEMVTQAPLFAMNELASRFVVEAARGPRRQLCPKPFAQAPEPGASPTVCLKAVAELRQSGEPRTDLAAGEPGWLEQADVSGRLCGLGSHGNHPWRCPSSRHCRPVCNRG